MKYAVESKEGSLIVSQILGVKSILEEIGAENPVVLDGQVIVFSSPESLDGYFSREIGIYGCKFRKLEEKEYKNMVTGASSRFKLEI